MKETLKIISVFLRLKRQEVREIWEGIWEGIEDNWGLLITIVILITSVTLLAMAEGTTNLLLCFVAYFLISLEYTIIGLVLLAAICVMIYNFCKWIRSNWQKATRIVKGQANVR